MPGFRLSVRDAAWLPFNHLRVIGPLTGVTASTVRQSLLALHRRDPNHPAFCRLDRAGRRWLPLTAAEFAATVIDTVAELPGTMTEPFDTVGGPCGDEGQAKPGPAAALRRVLLRWELDEWPLRILLHRGFVGVRMSHAVGDGNCANALIPGLLGAAEPVPPRFARRTRLALARASLRHFARDPRRLGALLTVPRPVLSPPTFDAPHRAWRPDPCAYYVRSGTDLLPHVRRWRDRYLPGVSVAAVLFAAVRAAFEECGLAPDHRGVLIQVDARRYLPDAATAPGNFAAGQYLEPADPRDPRAVHDALGQAVASARPLTTMAIRDLRALGSRGRPAATPDWVRADAAPILTMTHNGRLPSFDALPWACPPDSRVLMSSPTTDGAEGVTVSYAEVAGALHLNVTYHRSTFSEAAMRRALDLVCADPIGLVTVAGRRQPLGAGEATGTTTVPDTATGRVGQRLR